MTDQEIDSLMPDIIKDDTVKDDVAVWEFVNGTILKEGRINTIYGLSRPDFSVDANFAPNQKKAYRYRVNSDYYPFLVERLRESILKHGN